MRESSLQADLTGIKLEEAIGKGCQIHLQKGRHPIHTSIPGGRFMVDACVMRQSLHQHGEKSRLYRGYAFDLG